jgi:hypothetical protein
MISTTKMAILAIAASLASAYQAPQVQYAENYAWKVVLPDNST